jgi:hypothetical protein
MNRLQLSYSFGGSEGIEAVWTFNRDSIERAIPGVGMK